MHHPSPELVLKDAGVQKLLAQTLSKGGGVGVNFNTKPYKMSVCVLFLIK